METKCDEQVIKEAIDVLNDTTRKCIEETVGKEMAMVIAPGLYGEKMDPSMAMGIVKSGYWSITPNWLEEYFKEMSEKYKHPDNHILDEICELYPQLEPYIASLRLESDECHFSGESDTEQ